jgi:hypothetical protein
MNILAIFSKRANKPFMTSLEVIPDTIEGEPEFQSSYSTDENRFSLKYCTITQANYELIKDNAGTLNAPALIDSAESPKFEGRQNVYIQNGSLKIA